MKPPSGNESPDKLPGSPLKPTTWRCICFHVVMKRIPHFTRHEYICRQQLSMVLKHTTSLRLSVRACIWVGACVSEVLLTACVTGILCDDQSLSARYVIKLRQSLAEKLFLYIDGLTLLKFNHEGT